MTVVPWTATRNIAAWQLARWQTRAERAEAFIRSLPCTCSRETVGLCPTCGFVFELDRRDGR